MRYKCAVNLVVQLNVLIVYEYEVGNFQSFAKEVVHKSLC